MDKNRVSKYLDIWLDSIELENIDELEKDLEISLKELLYYDEYMANVFEKNN